MPVAIKKEKKKHAEFKYAIMKQYKPRRSPVLSYEDELAERQIKALYDEAQAMLYIDKYIKEHNKFDVFIKKYEWVAPDGYGGSGYWLEMEEE